MNGFDIIVLIIVGVAAIGGFMRGLVHEVLSLASWAVVVLAIHYFHTPFYEILRPYLGNDIGAAVLAFALLLLIPYFAMKLIAGHAGKTSRNSFLGPIDRVLGFGFGAIKGALIVVMAFSLLALGFDTMWGYKGRPEWVTLARAYPVVSAGSDALVVMLEERRESLRQDGEYR